MREGNRSNAIVNPAPTNPNPIPDPNPVPNPNPVHELISVSSSSLSSTSKKVKGQVVEYTEDFEAFWVAFPARGKKSKGQGIRSVQNRLGSGRRFKID